jgi:hypothetical protein
MDAMLVGVERACAPRSVTSVSMCRPSVPGARVGWPPVYFGPRGIAEAPGPASAAYAVAARCSTGGPLT